MMKVTQLPQHLYPSPARLSCWGCRGGNQLGGRREPNSQGVIDVHTHCAPDSTASFIDAMDLARLEKKVGMRGLVIKSHYEPTASIAYLVRKEVPGIEAFGGVDLNLSVGGMNPSAVEHMADITGGWGRFVWMSTVDSEAQVRVRRSLKCSQRATSIR